MRLGLPNRPSGAWEEAIRAFWVSLIPVLPPLMESDHENKDKTGTPGHSQAVGSEAEEPLLVSSRLWGQSLEYIRSQ